MTLLSIGSLWGVTKNLEDTAEVIVTTKRGDQTQYISLTPKNTFLVTGYTINKDHPATDFNSKGDVPIIVFPEGYTATIFSSYFKSSFRVGHIHHISSKINNSPRENPTNQTHNHQT